MNKIAAKLRILLSRLMLLVFIGLLIFGNHQIKYDSQISMLLDSIGFSLIVLGGFGRIWSSLYIEGYKTKRLIVDGPYALMRNPLYFFSLLMLFGYCCAIKSVIIFSVIFPFYLILYIPTILNEEKVLLNEHNNNYENYYNKTPRFFPNFSNYSKGDMNLTINLKNINRVLIEVVGFIFFYGMIKILEYLHFNNYISTYISLF